MAHLSTQRKVDAGEKFSGVDERLIFKWLYPAMERFVAALPPVDRAMWDKRQGPTLNLMKLVYTATNSIPHKQSQVRSPRWARSIRRTQRREGAWRSTPVFTYVARTYYRRQCLRELACNIGPKYKCFHPINLARNSRSY
jgi:hypothetical protein